MKSVYTWSERNVKKYTAGKAVYHAKRRLGHIPMCMNGVPNLDMPLTLEEVNQLVDSIVDESIMRA